MRYANIKWNDIANAPGVCVSVYLQGCPIRCKGCHNQSIWDFGGGEVLTQEVIDSIVQRLTANDVQRGLCILGGEPLCKENLPATCILVMQTKEKTISKIYIWTGYTYEQLLNSLEFYLKNGDIKSYVQLKMILGLADYLIDGPYIEEQRDITLKMRGSRNQRIWDLKQKLDITGKI